MGEEQTINVPQLIIVLLLGGFAIRYFFFTAPSSTNRQPGSSANNLRAREADVERIQQMFPQVARRTIMWDLQRNGGNIAATTERILSGRGLEVPPPTFQPPTPVAASSSSNAGANSSTGTPKPAQPNLITRYNLAAKVAAGNEEMETADAAPGGKQSWSQNKGERQSLMQRRREEMILAARRKMEAKIAAEGKLSE